MNRDKDTKDLAAYLKITPGEVRNYRISEPEKKPSKGQKLEQKLDQSEDAVNCQNGTANYCVPGPDGILYCTLQAYCKKRSTDAMTKDSRKAQRCLGRKRT